MRMDLQQFSAVLLQSSCYFTDLIKNVPDRQFIVFSSRCTYFSVNLFDSFLCLLFCFVFFVCLFSLFLIDSLLPLCLFLSLSLFFALFSPVSLFSFSLFLFLYPFCPSLLCFFCFFFSLSLSLSLSLFLRVTLTWCRGVVINSLHLYPY